MRIIYNNIIPFNGFIAINLFGVLFVRKGCRVTEKTLTHESIHTEQQKELLYIGFYLWYIVEWLIRVLFTKHIFSHKAYTNISFEREAYLMEKDNTYLERRKHFAFTNYL